MAETVRKMGGRFFVIALASLAALGWFVFLGYRLALEGKLVVEFTSLVGNLSVVAGIALAGQGVRNALIERNNGNGH